MYKRAAHLASVAFVCAELNSPHLLPDAHASSALGHTHTHTVSSRSKTRQCGWPYARRSPLPTLLLLTAKSAWQKTAWHVLRSVLGDSAVHQGVHPGLAVLCTHAPELPHLPAHQIAPSADHHHSTPPIMYTVSMLCPSFFNLTNHVCANTAMVQR
jgi:hypothetical protein